MPEMQCGNCQSLFDAKRRDAVFCSPRCRVAANRAGKSCEPSLVDSVTPKRETVRPDNGRCEFCRKSMSVGCQPKRFCSDKCRVYANRGKSPGAATGKPKRQLVTPKATKRNKRQIVTAKTPKRNTTPEPSYVYQRQYVSGSPGLHRFEFYTRRNGDMWMYPWVCDAAEVPIRPDPSVDEPWPTVPFVKFDELKWHPQRQRGKRESRAVLYPKPGNENVKYCPGGRAYQSKYNQCSLKHLKSDYMSEKQARKYVEFVEPEAEWHKPKPKTVDPLGGFFKWVEGSQAKRELHLKTLGVTDDNPQAIKRAYRQLATEHHPDHGGDGKRFAELATAYESMMKKFKNNGREVTV